MKPKFHVLITDAHHNNFHAEKEVLQEIGAKVHIGYCKNEEELLQVDPCMDALLVSYVNVGKKAIKHFSNCKVMVKYAVGVDNIDLATATKNKVFVANVPDYCTEDVSTHAMTLLLTLVRKILIFDKSVKNGIWNPLIADPIYRIQGKTLGIIGFGRNGRCLAEKIYPFKVNIIASDPTVKSTEMADYGVKKVDLNFLFKESDYISIHCPLNESTYHLINKQTIGIMKPKVFLVNTSRGSVINQSDLYRALTNGKFSGIALDVMENEPPKNNDILKMDHVIYTPHVSWHSEEAEITLRTQAALEVKRVLQGGKPINLVNKELLSDL